MTPFLFIDLCGLTLSEDEVGFLRHPLVVGVVLFSRNYADPGQLYALTSAIKSIRPELLIAIDQEGGRVQRLTTPFTTIPPMGRFGQWYQEAPEKTLALLQETAWLIGAELRAMHIDINFAPVLDRDIGVSQVIGDRSFGDDPAVIVNLAQRMIDGLIHWGVLPVGKHFPGHGAVAPDSHKSLPIDAREYDTIASTDLQPFAMLMQVDCLPAVMMSHVVYSRVDEQPAGFSSTWVTAILRNQLNYKGLVFTDDLSMAAARTCGSLLSTIDQSLVSGCDMVLVCNYQQDIDFGCLLSSLDGLSEPAKKQRQANYDWPTLSEEALSWAALQQHERYCLTKQALLDRGV